MNSKALICITTCNRLNSIKTSCAPFIRFCNENPDFHFLIALDGHDQEYITFCEKYEIPLIYSDEREGVGLSKNRVLTQFPQYEYYFFIDDDMELLNGDIFKTCIKLGSDTDTHHLSFKVNGDHKKITKNGHELIVGYRGAGCFNFYTKLALEKVGGWHTIFAKYKRFGHTEHSYRVFYQNLNIYPYVCIEGIRDYLILNDPPSVSTLNISKNQNELIEEEQELIDSKFDYFPVETISDYHFNGKDVELKSIHEDLERGRYKLLPFRERVKARGNFFYHRFESKKNPIFLLLALLLYPTNNLIKHRIKELLGINE